MIYDLEAYHRQQVRLAIEAAENCIRPRYWLSRYGLLAASTGIGSLEINKEYLSHRKRITAKTKKTA